MQSKNANLTEMPSRTALTRLGGALRLFAFVAALGSILATFLLVTGLVNIQLTERTAIILVVATAAVALVLGAVVAFDLIRLFSQFRQGQAGARLHLRIVGLFTLIAAVPAILIAIVASITIERGLNPWFSGALRELVTNAGTIAEGYQQQLCQNVGREMRLMAEDIDRAKRVGLYEQDRNTFKSFVTSRAVMLGFPFAVLMKADGTIIERADTKSSEEPQPPREQDFKDAETSEQPCLLTARHVGALIRVPSFDGAYLFVARQVDQRAIAFGQVAEQAVEQYRLLDAQRENVQRAFAIMYAIITLMLLLSAIWLGIAFADRLVAPIRRLITATDAVSAGNLYVQVPIQKSEGDIGHLGQTFNNMIAEIRGQQNRIVSASEALDRRRQFTEAVLSGVSVGVIGLDDTGQIAIANPVAESIMGRELAGRRLADVSEEIDQLFQEARRSRSGGFQRQVDLSAGGRERTLFVRVTSEKAAAADRRGFVVTIDDISDLVTAQRTSAWADVARRIAHEIKNPLTPIQLSAERIRRKYGRVIVQDREIFEQCTDTIIRQVDDIRRMVDEFSSFARMPKPQPEQEDLVETLRQTLFMMRVGNPTITFTDNLPAGPVMVRFDRRLIGQAVQNVLKNGVEGIAARQDSAPGPGRIALKLWAVEQHGLAIDIIDNGVGFPTENRQRLLEPYMTTREGGTGLGLPIVAKIFEEHGGGIELFDNPDGERGAMVRLTLAIDGPAASEPPQRGIGGGIQPHPAQTGAEHPKSAQISRTDQSDMEAGKVSP
jgi:two-component system, NtrC family, nitrogen regulation sensor histidine kinase NtrY